MILSSCAAKHPLHELQRSLQEQEDFRTACLSAITKLQQTIRSKAASLGHYSTAATPKQPSADIVNSMTCAELAAYVASLRQEKSKLHEMVSASAARPTTSSFDSSGGARRAEALRPPAVPNSATLAAMSAYAEAMLGYHTARLAACQVLSLWATVLGCVGSAA